MVSSAPAPALPDGLDAPVLNPASSPSTVPDLRPPAHVRALKVVRRPHRAGAPIGPELKSGEAFGDEAKAFDEATGFHGERDDFLESLRSFYTEATRDYRAWSAGYNMHFGWYAAGMNPFRRESMLERMNGEVLARVGVTGGRVADLGCGLGATARFAARASADLRITGLTIVPWQVREAQRMTREAGLADRVRFRCTDYTASGLRDAGFDGAYALESACHASGRDKADFLAEAYRLLKPGGRLVVFDGMLKRAPRSAFLKWCLRGCHRRWALETFAVKDAFLERMAATGFEIIQVEDLSWRVAPSALHIPAVTARFLAQMAVERLRHGKRAALSKERWGNALAPTLGLILGMSRHLFGYYAVTAVKR